MEASYKEFEKWKNLRQASPTTRKQRYKQRIFNQETFLSIKHFVWKQEPRARKGSSSPEGQFNGESQAAVKSVTLKISGCANRWHGDEKFRNDTQEHGNAIEHMQLKQLQHNTKS